MMTSDRDELEGIFEDLCKITPFGRKPELANKLFTEAEAVCSYAMSQEFGLNSNNMFLGIDVGGSTSDILLIAKILRITINIHYSAKVQSASQPVYSLTL